MSGYDFKASTLRSSKVAIFGTNLNILIVTSIMSLMKYHNASMLMLIVDFRDPFDFSARDN